MIPRVDPLDEEIEVRVEVRPAPSAFHRSLARKAEGSGLIATTYLAGSPEAWGEARIDSHSI